MLAGSMKQRVSIQSQSTTLDGYGEPANTWTTDSTVWASIVPLSGTEQQVAEGTTGIITHRVVMRYNTDASPQKRLLFGSKVLGIESVINTNEADKELQLLCREEIN
jgi:SPP1 family predicted phage head-tail adaptor